MYSLPALAPEIARDLHVAGTLVGSFVATAYGVGILSALISPGESAVVLTVVDAVVLSLSDLSIFREILKEIWGV